MSSENPFPQPTRQSSAAIIFILGNVFKLLIRQFWVVILVMFFNPKKQVFNSFTFFFLGLAVFGAITSIINYFRYFFYIRDGELVMEKGVFRKVKVNVPLDRIQTVNFKQGILHQFFNVMAVDIDTAGSSGNEFSLQAIGKEQAEALRAYVESNRQPARQAPALENETSSHPSFVETSPNFTIQKARVPTANPQLLFTLRPSDLLKIGISQNHLRTAGIIMAFFLGFADDVEEALDLDFSKKMEEWAGSGNGIDLLYYVLVSIPLLLIVSFLISLVRTTLQYFDLKFWRTEGGFKIVSGLFTRQEVSANLRKIQFVRWDSSPLMRMFGMIAVRLLQAASVESSRKTAVNLPGCYEAQLDAVRAAYFPEEKQLEYEQHGVDKRIIRRQFFLQGILPAGLFMLITHSLLAGLIWIWTLWLPVALWLSIKYYQQWQWFVCEEAIQANWGFVNRRSVLLQWYKVQAVSIRQSIFLKQAGLAHIVLYTAAGNLRVPYIPLSKAKTLRDFVLYKIESDKRAWM